MKKKGAQIVFKKNNILIVKKMHFSVPISVLTEKNITVGGHWTSKQDIAEFRGAEIQNLKVF